MDGIREYEVILTRENIREFCGIISRFNSDFNVCSGRISVDGKSILGLFTLNFELKMTLTIIVKDDKIEVIEDAIHEFITI